MKVATAAAHLGGETVHRGRTGLDLLQSSHGERGHSAMVPAPATQPTADQPNSVGGRGLAHLIDQSRPTGQRRQSDSLIREIS